MVKNFKDLLYEAQLHYIYRYNKVYPGHTVLQAIEHYNECQDVGIALPEQGTKTIVEQKYESLTNQSSIKFFKDWFDTKYSTEYHSESPFLKYTVQEQLYVLSVCLKTTGSINISAFLKYGFCADKSSGGFDWETIQNTQSFLRLTDLAENPCSIYIPLTDSGECSPKDWYDTVVYLVKHQYGDPELTNYLKKIDAKNYMAIYEATEVYNKNHKASNNTNNNNNNNNNTNNNNNMEDINIEGLKEDHGSNNSLFDLGDSMDFIKEQIMPISTSDVKVTLNGDICFPIKNGRYITIKEDGERMLYTGSFCMNIQAFIFPKTKDCIQVGDYLKLDNTYGRVVEIKKNGVKVVKLNGTVSTVKELSDCLTGTPRYNAVVSMMDFMPGVSPMVFMIFDKKKNINDVFKMCFLQNMMSQNGNGNNMFNMANGNMGGLLMMSMLQQLFPSDGKDEGGISKEFSSILPIMMISGMGGMNGNNLFGGFANMFNPNGNNVNNNTKSTKSKSTKATKVKEEEDTEDVNE